MTNKQTSRKNFYIAFAIALIVIISTLVFVGKMPIKIVLIALATSLLIWGATLLRRG